MEKFKGRETEQPKKHESLEGFPNPLEAIEILQNSLEISPTIHDNIAICVIKPDAFVHRDAIVERLKESGLYIVKRTDLVLPENFVVNEMYGGDHLPKQIAEATRRHFLSGPSEIILVKGDNLLAKLLQTVGLKTNPALCDPETVRFMYGDHVPEDLDEGLQYYKNAAHRGTTPAEIEADLQKFRNIL